MKAVQSILPRPAQVRSILAGAAALLILGAADPASAKKGGKGGGGGGGSDPGPSLIAAPVEYRITWLDWPEPVTQFEIEDINSSGHAVGWCKPEATGKNIAVLADAQGNLWNLDERGSAGLFASALQAFPGWRFNTVEQINANGDIAGTLVPDVEPTANGSDDVIVVVGNIYASPCPLTAVDLIENNAFNIVADLTDSGDVLLRLRWAESAPGIEIGVCTYYRDALSGGTTSELIEAPANSDAGIYSGNTPRVNEHGEISFSAAITTTTTTTRGKKTTTTESTAYHSYFRDVAGGLTDLGPTHPWCQIAEDGSIYVSRINNIPNRWSPLTQTWERVAPGGRVKDVSSAPAGEEVLITDGFVDAVSWYLFKRDVGAFSINVSSATGGASQLERLTSSDYRYTEFVSQPTEPGYGFITGYAGMIEEGGRNNFILTPIAVAP